MKIKNKILFSILFVSIYACNSYKKQNQLGISVIGIESLHPYRCISIFDTRILTQVYSTLIRTGKNGQYIPDLAGSWECKNDTVWTFYLRENAFFHDGNDIFPEGGGRNVTAADVKYSYELLVSPETKALQTHVLQYIQNVNIIDDYTVQFITTKVYPYFLTYAQGIGGLFIIPHELVDRYGVDNLAAQAVGSGPFQFSKFIPDEFVILSKNEDYWIEPHLGEVIFKVIPNIMTSEMALESGETDMMFGMKVNTVTRLSQVTKFVHIPGEFADLTVFTFNVNDPRFSDRRVRQAISYAIDKESIMNAVYDQYATVTCNYIPPKLAGFNKSLMGRCGQDIEKAQELLKEAGWNIGADGIYEKGTLRLEFSIIVLNRQEFVLMTNLAAAQLREIGILLKPVQLEFGTWLNKIHEPDLEMYWDNGYNYEYALYELFHSECEFSGSGWQDLNVDEMLDKAMATMDESTRGKIWKTVQKRMIDEMVCVPIGHAYPVMTLAGRIHDFSYHPNQYLNLTTIENNVWVD